MFSWECVHSHKVVIRSGPRPRVWSWKDSNLLQMSWGWRERKRTDKVSAREKQSQPKFREEGGLKEPRCPQQLPAD